MVEPLNEAISGICVVATGTVQPLLRAGITVAATSLPAGSEPWECLGARRDQSMEMAKDFQKNCSDVKVTILQNAADYTVHFEPH